MARRKRRSRLPAAGATAGALAALLIAVRAVVTEAERRPHLVLAVAWGLAALAALGGGLWWHRRREQAAADADLRQIQAARAREITAYLEMSPREFERALAYLCERDGCSKVRVVGGAGDLGADVVAVTPQGQSLVIQAKRYRVGNQVSGPDLQRFGGTCYAIHGAHIAAVVTTSGFTRQARAYAGRLGIQVYDQEALAGWASGTGPAPWTV